MSEWFRDERTLALGDVCRYRVVIRNKDPDLRHVYLRVKNMERTGLRAFHLLNGPFIVYCHVIPHNYRQDKPFEGDVHFRNTVKPGQTFNVKLLLDENSLRAVENGVSVHEWSCDVVCQVVLNRRARVRFWMMIGPDLGELRRLLRSVLTQLGKGELPAPEVKRHPHLQALLGRNDSSDSKDADESYTYNKDGVTQLDIELKGTNQIWRSRPRTKDPCHYVVLTHGIFLNLTADMLYLHDQITSRAGEHSNVFVEGFRGNAGRTEKGVHKLGVGVAEHVVARIQTLEKEGYPIEAILFVGHSLGGVVQLYALRHILLEEGEDYFERRNITLKHFVCMASPMLGILSEMSLWISWFLDLGTLGKTGRDLTLLKKLPPHDGHWRWRPVRPILETLPDEPVKTLLKHFHLRVIYANAINDGIVPLRTSAMLYLDWEALGNVEGLHEDSNAVMDNEEAGARHEDDATNLNLSSDSDSEHAPSTATVSDAGDSDKTSVQSQDTPDSKDSSVESSTSRHSQPLASSRDNPTAESSPQDDQEDSDINVGQIPGKFDDFSDKYSSFLARIFNFDDVGGFGRRRRVSRRIKRYAKITAKASDEPQSQSESDEDDNNLGADDGDGDTEEVRHGLSSTHKSDTEEFAIPPKALAVSSAINSMICPIPSTRYIKQPESRRRVIFHDKYYHFKNIPARTPRTGPISKFWRYHAWRMDKQEKIARKYHVSELTWRKVLVCLPPDAHNNIVVRRRFANGYGWGVIDHLTLEVFYPEKLNAKF